MLHTREIPREVWSDYLTLVSAIEKDHRVRVQADGPDFGEQTVAASLPLVDIYVEEKGSDEGAIEVTVGRPGREITHRILRPLRVYTAESDSGDIECLDIEDEDHVKTLIFFEPQMALEEALPQPHSPA
jgi:hypothetical protein